MNMDYSLERTDFLVHQLFAASKSERVIKSRRNSRIRLPIFYFILGVILFILADLVYALIFIGIGLAWYVFHPYFMRRRYVRHFEKYIDENFQNRFGKTVSISFDDEFIQAFDYLGESKLRISEITEISEIREYIFLKFSSGETLIVPKDRVNNRNELNDEIAKITSDRRINHRIDLNWKWN